jgi:D-tyrosyl-tRNA(Tyr) deacylase
VQRVDSASVSIDGNVVAAIGKGVVVFLGVEKGDEESDAEYLLDKIINLRIFEDDAGKMNHSVIQVSGEMLVVSQFTLLGDTAKGRRPSFVHAEEPVRARLLYEFFLQKVASRVRRMAAGEFRTMMKVELINDGPVTMLVNSRKHFQEA